MLKELKEKRKKILRCINFLEPERLWQGWVGLLELALNFK